MTDKILRLSGVTLGACILAFALYGDLYFFALAVIAFALFWEALQRKLRKLHAQQLALRSHRAALALTDRHLWRRNRRATNCTTVIGRGAIIRTFGMSEMAIESWEVRRALRWGSEHITACTTREAAEAVAKDDIAKHGSVGRIENVVAHEGGGGCVYYDVFEEMC